MDNTHRNNRPKIDTSVKKLAILDNGETAIITGKGLAIAGAQAEIDITDLPPEEEAHLRRNMHDIRVSQKGDRITLRPRSGRAITLRERKQHGA